MTAMHTIEIANGDRASTRGVGQQTKIADDRHAAARFKTRGGPAPIILASAPPVNVQQRMTKPRDCTP
jgi:hypothetical protein